MREQTDESGTTDENGTTDDSETDDQQETPAPNIIRTVINFVLLFFTSLIPTQPPPVNAN